MIVALLAALQSVPSTMPDIELHATIDAESVRIEKQGKATLEVHADPDAGSIVKADAPRANGATTLRNVRVKVDAEARISGGAKAKVSEAPPQETVTPQPR